MPNINKVVFGTTTLIDLTDSTLSGPSQLASGVTAYDRTGTKITGTGGGGGGSDPTSIQVYIEQDQDGYLLLDDVSLITTAVGVSF